MRPKRTPPLQTTPPERPAMQRVLGTPMLPPNAQQVLQTYYLSGWRRFGPGVLAMLPSTVDGHGNGRAVYWSWAALARHYPEEVVAQAQRLAATISPEQSFVLLLIIDREQGLYNLSTFTPPPLPAALAA